MSELGINEAPETFEERKKAVAKTLTEAAAAYDEESRFRAISRAMENDRVPDYTSDKSHDEPEGYDNYAWKITARALGEAILMDKDEIREAIKKRQEMDNPVSATDGSKGQWEFGRKRRLEALHWLLEGEKKVGEITGKSY